MPTPRTSSEHVKVRLEDQERQRAREQDQTVSLLDEYWGIPDPQYPSCFSEQKLHTMTRRKENRDPFLASTSGVSTLSDVSEKKGSRQLMVLGKFCGVFNSRSPSLLFWSTLTLLLTSMTMTKMSKELETLREKSSTNTISLVRLLGDLKEKEEQLKNSRDENQKITEILKELKRNNELSSKELIKEKSSIKQLSRECQALEKQLSGAQDNIKSKEEKYQRQAEINETKNLAAMLLLTLLISQALRLKYQVDQKKALLLTKEADIKIEKTKLRREIEEIKEKKSLLKEEAELAKTHNASS